MRICESMEENYEMIYLYLDQEKICYFIGHAHYWDQEKDEIRVVNRFNDFIRFKFIDLINMYRS